MSQASSTEKNILIVEDNAPSMLLTCALIKRILPTAAISKATDGETALALLNSQTFDLIVLDLVLPDINGIIIAEKVRTTPNHPNFKTPIIALTANVFPIVQEQCMKAGINNFIPKPTSEATLRETIEKYLEIARL